MAIVREATEADVPRIVELYNQLTISKPAAEEGRSPSPEDYREIYARIRQQPGHELVVAEDRGEVTGTMVFVIIPNLSHKGLPWAVIENMVVEENSRRSGIGRLMIDYALKRSKETGCYKIQLASTNSRNEAHAFYRSMGVKDAAKGVQALSVKG